METFISTLVATCLSAAATTIVGLVIKHAVNKNLQKHEKYLQEHDAYIELQKKEADRLANEHLLDQINECLAPVNKKINNVEALLQLNTTGTIMLLREAMLQEHNRLIKQDKITQHELHRWLELYDAYKALGGNHFAEYVNGWKANIMNLPIDVVKEG